MSMHEIRSRYNMNGQKTPEEEIRQIEHTFHDVQSRYSLYHRTLSRMDFEDLKTLGDYLVGMDNVRATDLAFSILEYVDGFKNIEGTASTD